MQIASNLFVRAAVVALPAVALACGSGGSDNNSVTNVATPTLTTINVALSAPSVAVGGTATASASGVDQNGAAIGLGSVTWSSTVESVATVSSAGVITGVAPGTTQIVASAGGKTGSATFTVIVATR